MKKINEGIKEKLLSVDQESNKITYHVAKDYTTSFKNPEERVRAAYFVELVKDYSYPANRIELEAKVERRTPDDRADIVVYEDDELKVPYLIVECKREGITDAEFNQAIEQAFGNANSKRAKYAIVVAGITRKAFYIEGFKPSERIKNVIGDVSVKYGKPPKYKFICGDTDRDLKIVTKSELISTLEKCHDTVWQGGRLAPTTAFDEVAKLLFCKLKDEKDCLVGEPYAFQIGTHETPEEVFQRVNKIYQLAKKQDEDVFKEDIRLEPKIVYSVVNHLQEININDTELDSKGVAFEKYMQEYFRGKMGQFFTPRTVVQFAVNMMLPDTEKNKNTLRVLDPACGSGGFLLMALDNVRKFAEKNIKGNKVRDYWHDFAANNLFGIEINDQIARVSKMNMIIHDDGHTNVISVDSLEKFERIPRSKTDFKKDSFDLIITNPPFGASVKATEKDYLKEYELGKNNGKERKNQKTEILFIERCIQFLKPGTGKMAIVLPDGILTNSSLQYVRDFILEHTQLIAVVSLPQTAFTHYGAGVKSSLVFVRKKDENEIIGNYPIFMAIAEYIGYDATGREIPQNDFPEILEKFLEFEANN
ncbi:type i restriction-modification system, dna-methyltransferase subunit m / s [hydrocarbon metagenome]|uniref:Type i restriction-modification system, dna-methyltransferase subunit m / s n=1 Tax=hydrocarbon metagenome TaxID=938273 RepID=A0A0W8FXE8_9ZZZZ